MSTLWFNGRPVNVDVYADDKTMFVCPVYGNVESISDGVIVGTRNGWELWSEDASDNEAFVSDYNNEYYSNDDYEAVEVHLGYRNVEIWTYDQAIHDCEIMQCADCDEYWHVDYLTYISDTGDYVCEDCRDSNGYFYCERCEEWYSEDSYGGDGLCTDCYEDENDEIAGYHDHDYGEYTYVGEKKPNAKNYTDLFGIELEVDNGRNRNDCASDLRYIYSGLNFERDGSLSDSGFEIITVPHTKTEFYKIPWDKIMNKLKDYGFKSHDAGTCGLHVHVCRTAFGSTKDEQKRSTMKIIDFYHRYFEDITKAARRTDSQVRSWAKDYLELKEAEAYGIKYYRKVLKRIVDDDRYNNRYMAVNLTNRNTIEFRIMRGTLNLDSFYACIDFITTLALEARYMNFKSTAKDWLKKMKSETLRYLKNRGCSFDGAVDELIAERNVA